jgi:hypothetical protein
MALLSKTAHFAFAAALAGLAFARAELPNAESNATRALREADAICQSDNGALWGTSLCGPVLLVDPVTRLVVANQLDRENRLKSNGESFVGKLSEQINIANTAVDWPEGSGR